jgi:hypothetical protein
MIEYKYQNKVYYFELNLIKLFNFTLKLYCILYYEVRNIIIDFHLDKNINILHKIILLG